MFINPRRRTLASCCLTVALAASIVLVVPCTASAAAKAKTATKSKPKTNTAKYCAAAKAWLAFENATSSTGPYDQSWVDSTQKLLRAMTDSLPLSKAVKPREISALQFVVFANDVLQSRRVIAGITAITEEAQIAALGATAEQLRSVSRTGIRDLVGEYTLKTCKIDVLQPFRDLAAGFE